MKCREFQPLKATLDFGLQHGDDNNNNNSLVTMCNLNPNLIVYLQNVTQSNFKYKVVNLTSDSHPSNVLLPIHTPRQ